MWGIYLLYTIFRKFRLWFSKFWRRVVLEIVTSALELLTASLKIEAESSSETLVTISNTTRRQNLENHNKRLKADILGSCSGR
jgi:hypothetical protein